MISFAEELKYIESYLNLEKLRYDERLRVVYHIETDEFKVPALCIQPLVENSVKHGIGQKEDGGVLCLTTNKTEHSYVVIIEDTGVGFDYNTVKNDGRVHVGIENIKMRIDRMCGGTLDITSECSKGTTVTVKIPKAGMAKYNMNKNREK